MATAREYFEKDSSKTLRVDSAQQFKNPTTNDTIPVDVGVSLDFTSGTKYGWLFFKDIAGFNSMIHMFLDDPNLTFGIHSGVDVVMGLSGTDESIPSASLRPSGRLFAYVDGIVDKNVREKVTQEATARGTALVIRDAAYFAQRNKLEKPLAFISHDSRDKEPIVRELAAILQSMMCPVWYDEFSLKVGDGLRESIENGLKISKKCILVLSPNYFSNAGWSKSEFEAIYTREFIEGRRVVLPIWHGVTKQQVYEYSPRLADVGLKSSLGIEELAKQLYSAITAAPN